jgi:hypothetical protein
MWRVNSTKKYQRTRRVSVVTDCNIVIGLYIVHILTDLCPLELLSQNISLKTQMFKTHSLCDQDEAGTCSVPQQVSVHL